MDAGFTGLPRPVQPVTTTLAPKAAEAVVPHAKTDLPETKTVTPPTESEAVRLDKKRVKEDEQERDRDRRRKQSQSAEHSADDETASLSDQAANAYVSACAGGYISDDPAASNPANASMRAYHKKLAGGNNPALHRVEKLA